MPNKFLLTEAQIQKQILEYLNLRGHFCFRNNTGTFFKEYNGKRYAITSGIKGSSDILGVSKQVAHYDGGKFIAIECKRPGKTATVEQEAFLQQVRQRGGIALVADDVEVVRKAGL